MWGTSLCAAADWTTVSPWVPLLAAAVAVWYLGRHGGGTALQNMEQANRILERTQHALEERVATLEKENAELRGRTDVALAIERSMSLHEARAQSRHEATAVILSLIAERLGPDKNGAAGGK